eukprot:TRINITY_DN317_c0_g1_i17.p1 TRINITY_DN317_c0_g1~~TRINITY_DN317_c0_g1_i17.p1  ORF type:complete len:106 (+),score=11.83 TRINITY_DN317_c0_g1_i17:1204-1521(+)
MTGHTLNKAAEQQSRSRGSKWITIITPQTRLFRHFMTEYTLNKAAEQQSRSRGSKWITIITQYKEQLDSLMNTLEATYPHFFCCKLWSEVEQSCTRITQGTISRS